MADRMNRRQLMTRALALGCSVAASPILTPVSFAALPGQRRLVVIVLRGAMDGLDVFRPSGDPNLSQLRPHLAQENTPLPLDNFFALHPALSGLMPLWHVGEMAFVPATSTLYRDQRSHFDGQDHLEAGTAGALPPALQRDGWLNRLVAQLPGAQARTAFAVGRERMLILEGQAAITQWSPGTDLDLSPQNRLLLSYLFRNDPLFAQAGQIALEMTTPGTDDDDDDLPTGGDAAGLGRYIAQQLLAESRIASFSLTGWDTHRDQHRALLPALGRLQDAILALRDGLGGAWGDTTVMAMTEFGRTARENGARSTDHGTGGALLLAGGGVARRACHRRLAGAARSGPLCGARPDAPVGHPRLSGMGDARFVRTAGFGH